MDKVERRTEREREREMCKDRKMIYDNIKQHKADTFRSLSLSLSLSVIAFCLGKNLFPKFSLLKF